MLITGCSVCIPNVDVLPDGRLFVGKMTYTKRGRTTVRHMMETGKNGHSIMETLEDGVFKEGAKDRMNFSYELLSSTPIHMEFVGDQENPNGTHIKVVFPVRIPVDKLRDFASKDDDDQDEEHGPIRMTEISELIRETEKRTIPFHFRSTLAVVRWAGKRYERCFSRYEDLLIVAERELYSYHLNPEQERAIAFYPGVW